MLRQTFIFSFISLNNMFFTIIDILILLFLVVVSIMDIKRREVDDYLSYGFFLFAISFRLLLSIVYWDYVILLKGLFGFIIAYIIASFFFYTRQWGGGDAKILIGLGVLLGFDLTFNATLLVFIINLIFASVIYSVLWAIALFIKHRNKTLIFFKDKLFSFGYFFLILILFSCIGFGIFFITSFFWSFLFVMICLFLFLIGVLFVFLKTVETVAFVKEVSVSQLTVGDWLVEDINVNEKVILSKKTTGLEFKDIVLLGKLEKKNEIKSVSIKSGIPFLPSFFIAYVMMLLFSNWYIFLFPF